MDEKLSEFLQLAPSKKVSLSSRFFHFLEQRKEAETVASNNDRKNPRRRNIVKIPNSYDSYDKWELGLKATFHSASFETPVRPMRKN